MNPGERTIAHLAQDAGFATGAIGKMHFIGSDQHQGFRARWDVLDYFAAEPAACGDAASGMAAPGCFGKYTPGEEGSVAGGPNPMRTHNGNYDAQPSPFPADRHFEAYTTREAIRFLEEHQDERWLLFCSYVKPHAPYTPPAEDWERYASLPLPVPPVDKEDLDALPAHLKQFRNATGVAELDEEGMRRCIAGYYGCITFVDREIGKVLTSLDTMGLRDETLVIFTSDHGDMMGAHGLLAKSNFYEESWHVPLIVSHPEYGGQNARTDALACLTDLFPTIAEALGLPVPANLHGRSLLPVIAGRQEGVRDHVYSELHVRDGRFAGVFDGQWKLAVYTDMEQLFNLAHDPQERRNLVDDAPEEANRLRRFIDRAANA